MNRLCFNLYLISTLATFLFLSNHTAAQWTQVPAGTTSDLYSVEYDFTGSGVWVGGINGITYSSNGGSSFSWKPGINSTTGGSPLIGVFYDIHVFTTTEAVGTGIINIGNDEVIFRTANTASSWAMQYTNNSAPLPRLYNKFAFRNALNGIAVGENGKILRTTDGGFNWTLIASGTALELNDIAYIGSNTYVIVGNTISLRSTNDGLSWSAVPLTSTYNCLSFSGQTGYASAIGSTLIKTSDGGISWNTIPQPLVAGGDAIYAASSDTLYLGNNDDLFRSTTGGVYWESYHAPGYASVKEIEFYNNQTAIAVGEGGYIIKTTNGGGTTYPTPGFNASTTFTCVGQSISFSNISNPAYTFSWNFGGQGTSVNYNSSFTFMTPGTYTVTLTATTAGGTVDSTSETITVIALADVVPFPVTITNDTLCSGTSTTVNVPNSVNGVTYRLRNGFTNIGSSQTGNGTTRSFATGNLTTSTLFNIIGTTSNSCSSDSSITFAPITVINLPVNNTASLSRDTICPNDTSSIVILFSDPAFTYTWTSVPVSTGPAPVQGNGGTIILPIGPITSSRTYTTKATHILSGCVFSLPNPQILRVVNGQFNVTISPNPAVAGSPVTITNISTGFTNFFWNFGAAATPSTYSGFNPPPVIYNSNFIDSIRYSAVVIDSTVCFRDAGKPFVALDAVIPVVQNSCRMDSLMGALDIQDMFLDAHNNKYVTGVYTNTYSQLYAAKMDSAGVLIWEFRHVYSESNYTPNYGISIIADDAGNAYVAVQNEGGEMSFRGTRAFSRQLVVSFDHHGEFRWAIGGNGSSFSDLHIAENGDFYAVGRLRSDTIVEFMESDGNIIEYFLPPTDTLSGDTYLMRFNQNGKIEHIRTFLRVQGPGTTPVDYFGFINESMPSNHQISPRITKGPNSTIIIGGFAVLDTNSATHYICGNIEVERDVSLQLSAAQENLLLVTYDPATDLFVNANAVLGGEFQSIRALTSDNSGNVYVSGTVKEYLVTNTPIADLNPTNLISNIPVYDFVARIDASGDFNWITHTKYGIMHDLEIIDDSILVVLGAIKNFGCFYDKYLNPYSLYPDGTGDAALIKYTTNGEFISVAKMGNSAADYSYAMEQDVCGNLHTAEIRNNIAGVYYPSTYNCGTGCLSQYLLYFPVYPKSGCSGICYSAYNTISKDIMADRLYLNDTSYTFTGSRNVLMTVRNQGQTPVTAMQIGYRINNNPVQTTNWNGNLSYSDTVIVPVTSHVFGARNFNRITAWVISVNGSGDNNQNNDTLTTTQVVCPNPMAGTYTVDQTGNADFESVAASAEACRYCGVSAPVYFDIAPGEYTEQMILYPIPGSSASDTVTWRAANGDSTSVQLKYKPGIAHIPAQLYTYPKTSFVTIKNLKFSRTDDSPGYLTWGPLIYLRDSCYNINITGNHLEGQFGSTTQSLYHDAVGSHNENVVINNNYFYGGAKGAYIQGSTFTSEDENTLVYGNIFRNQTTQGVEHIYANNSKVFNNLFYSDTLNVNPAWRAVWSRFGQTASITGNRIWHKTGISQNNGQGPFMLQELTSGPGAPNFIANNMIVNFNKGEPQGQSALVVYNVVDLQVYHNTFEMGVYIYGNNNSNISLQNNYITNSQQFIQNNDLTTFNVVDNNNYHKSTGVGPASFNGNGSWYSLTGWQALGWDINSDSIDAPFQAGDDLHLALSASPRGVVIPGIPADIDGDIRSAYIPFIGADEYNLFSDVWPGDVNNDNIVSHYDLLPIGLYFNENGNPRASISNGWQAWASNDWGKLQPNGTNIKFADCNGDGFINYIDTNAVVNLNFGLTHRLAAQVVLPFSQSVPGLYIEAGAVSYNSGDTAVLRVYGGTQAEPLSGLYSLGFDVLIDPSLIEAGTGSVNLDSCFFAFPGQRIAFGSLNESTGIAGISISRVDHVDTSGNGLIAIIKFVVKNALTQPISTVFGFAGYQAYNSQAVTQLLGLNGDSIVVFPPLSIQESSHMSGVYLAPNPALDNFTIYLSASNGSGLNITNQPRSATMTITNATGLVMHKEALNNTNTLTVSVRDWNAGVYFVEVKGTEFVEVKRVVVIK